MSCGEGQRCSADPALLWLWCRSVATVLIGPLAWEHPYAVGEALKRQKKKKEKEKKERKKVSQFGGQRENFSPVIGLPGFIIEKH